MPQADYDIANASGAAVRSDINLVLAAIVSNNSGATAPSTPFAFMWWFDTTLNILKIRDSANANFVNVASLVGTVWTPYFEGTLMGDVVTFDQGTAAGEVPINSDISPFLLLTGASIMWTSTVIPTGWLDCDGAAVSRVTFSDLFDLYNAIGLPWGVGDGSTTFNVPDGRGSMPIGAGTGAGLTARVLAAIGGVETHPLIIAELASHTHTVPTGDALGGLVRNTTIGTGALGSSPPTGATGSGTGHENMSPFWVPHFIVKT